MPTERFKRLPEGKKLAIREAVIQEFVRVPYEKVSINQIIQTADISRGSFYTYFDDKEDMVRWLFEDIREQIGKTCNEVLEETNGDYFAMLEAAFDYMLDSLRDTKELINVAKNVFSNQANMQMMGIGNMPMMSDYVREEKTVWEIYEKVDKSNLRVDDLEGFCSLVTIGGMMLLFSVGKYYECPEEQEKIREMFYHTLDLLRYGALKNRI